jgi:hypothetical protein
MELVHPSASTIHANPFRPCNVRYWKWFCLIKLKILFENIAKSQMFACALKQDKLGLISAHIP